LIEGTYQRAGLNSVTSPDALNADLGVQFGSIGEVRQRAGLNCVLPVPSPQLEVGVQVVSTAGGGKTYGSRRNAAI
jgi:hypothetical protein